MIPGSTILVIDDDAGLRAMLRAVLADHVETVLEADSAEKGLTHLDQTTPDLVLLDMRMPGMGGLGFLREAERRALAVPVVVITAFAEVEHAVEAMKLGAADYLCKPIDLSVLENLLDRFVRGAAPGEAQAEDVGHPPLPENMVFVSPFMNQVLREVAAVAHSTAPVLLTGESGTGKEVLAELLHRWGDHPAGPLVRINTTALPATLMESEFFGHEKGAFTGADRRRPGHFEQASGGTLFLDEIGELPLELQPKLLRAMETGAVRRLGGRSRDSPGRAAGLGHQPRPGGRGRGRPVPDGPLLPPGRVCHRDPSAPGTTRGRPGPGPDVSVRRRWPSAALFAGGRAVPAGLHLARQRARTQKQRDASGHPGRGRSHPS